jgi:hypothetical protein
MVLDSIVADGIRNGIVTLTGLTAGWLGRCECSWKHTIGKQPSVKVIVFLLKNVRRPFSSNPSTSIARKRPA